MIAVMAGAAALAGSAYADDKNLCTEKYSFEDQVILEWAALGGDPHAQIALSQCAYPVAVSDLSPAQRVYAIKWTTLAACEARATPAHDRRDARMRRLKENADLSFRRFGGMSKDEKLNWRERDFVKYRHEQFERLDQRRAALMQAASGDELAAAREEISEQFSRFGAIGLLRLAELSSCENFGAGPEFEAAAWSAADEAWRKAADEGVYAAPDSKEYDLAAMAREKNAGLSAFSQITVAEERAALMRTDPDRLARLEQQASMAEERAAATSLAAFTLPQREASGGLADAAVAHQPTLTLALQFALESLGHVDFVNGPDNDYGPTTRAAVARYHAAAGAAPATTISQLETRDAICAAAVVKDDPVSLYHVALMYQNGWGFVRDNDKASAAIARAETAMISRLGGADLPAWKRDAYRDYAGRIRAASASMKTAAGQDETLCE
ncbi:MAG: hypothetical protein R3C51_00920 [Parvularculaceae bacterium]